MLLHAEDGTRWQEPRNRPTPPPGVIPARSPDQVRGSRQGDGRECAGLVSELREDRIDRPLPPPVVELELLLGRGPAGIGDAVEGVEEMALVAAHAVELAPSGQPVAGDAEH